MLLTMSTAPLPLSGTPHSIPFRSLDTPLSPGVPVTPVMVAAASLPPDVLELVPIEALELLIDTVDMLVAKGAETVPRGGDGGEVNLRGVREERGRIIRRNSERDLRAAIQEEKEQEKKAQAQADMDTELQHSAITRRFYSKLPSPIPPRTYLVRLHKYCAHSSAVYLWVATTLFRLAHTEGTISLGRRNVHRLLLAALDVASKALEDHSWPHERIAQVGGVKAAELTRLEVGFCFLCDFELQVGRERLRQGGEEVRRVSGKWKEEEETKTTETETEKGMEEGR